MSAVDTEEECLSWDETVEMILNPDVYCTPHWREDGRPGPGKHADPDAYTLDDLMDMFQYDDWFCPLHIDWRYPQAPCGVWRRDYSKAHDRLVELTRKHTGQDSWEHVKDHPRLMHEYHATAAELRQVWKDFPHARFWFELDATEDRIAIQVVDR